MKFLLRADLAAKGISYSDMHLWQLEKSGKFPKRVSITPGRRAWVEAEIDAWVQARIAERDGEAA